MDPITAAIVAALPAMATDTVKSAVKDAYEGLRAVIQRKWGKDAPITKAVTALEEDPNSKAQAAVLEEKVAAVKATEDPEVAQALHKLVERLKAEGVGGETVAKIQAHGGESQFVRTDVSQAEDSQRLVEITLNKHGKLDILVNNAGIYTRGDVVSTSLEMWERMLAVNLTGVFLCCRAAIPALRQNGGGAIINISSSVGWHDAAPGIAAYTPSSWSRIGAPAGAMRRAESRLSVLNDDLLTVYNTFFSSLRMCLRQTVLLRTAEPYPLFPGSGRSARH